MTVFGVARSLKGCLHWCFTYALINPDFTCGILKRHSWEIDKSLGYCTKKNLCQKEMGFLM